MDGRLSVKPRRLGLQVRFSRLDAICGLDSALRENPIDRAFTNSNANSCRICTCSTCRTCCSRCRKRRSRQSRPFFDTSVESPESRMGKVRNEVDVVRMSAPGGPSASVPRFRAVPTLLMWVVAVLLTSAPAWAQEAPPSEGDASRDIESAPTPTPDSPRTSDKPTVAVLPFRLRTCWRPEWRRRTKLMS